MIEQKNLIEFKGVLTFEVIAQLINELKIRMEELQETMNIYKRILNIMVETLENVHKYSAYHEEFIKLADDFPTFFTLVKRDENYLITSGNLIKLDDQKNLEERILTINNLNSSELRKLYRKIISNGNFNREGGAGLGFIEIAKSSQSKINYHFERVNGTKTFFTIIMEIIK